jgi:hypothetical protein
MKRRTPAYSSTDLALARGLGVVSIGLGLIDAFGRRGVSAKTGIRNEGLVGLYGMREIATGVGLLIARNPMPWVWGRVAGDALDLGTLAGGVTPRNPQRKGALAGLLMVVGVVAIDMALAIRLHGAAEHAAQTRVSYATRSGFPAGVAKAWGVARGFVVPEDMRLPKLMRPYPEKA